MAAAKIPLGPTTAPEKKATRDGVFPPPATRPNDSSVPTSSPHRRPSSLPINLRQLVPESETEREGEMKKEGGGNGGGSKVGRMAEAPFRALRRARDAYVNGMTGFAGTASSRGIVGASRGYRFPPPRPGSGREDDLGELLRVASAPVKASEGAVPRSHSLGIARIDENEACDFGGDVVVGGGGPLWPRSRSCAEEGIKVGGLLA